MVGPPLSVTELDTDCLARILSRLPAEDVAAMLEEAHRERARMLQQIGDAMGGL